MSPIHSDLDTEANSGLSRIVTLDVTVLNSLADPEIEDGSDLVVELIDLYLEESTRLLQGIKVGIETRDGMMVKRAAHSLRGSSGNLGILKTAQICWLLEQREPGDAVVTGLVQQLDQELVEVSQILQHERQRRTS